MSQIWIIIIGLAVGTWLLRFSFLGLMGGRDLPPWALRHLRYTAVAILPGLVAPLVMFPTATDGTFSPPHLAAALATVAVGWWRQSLIIGFCTGFAVLYGGLYVQALWT